MPVVMIHLLEGRNQDKKKRLMAEVTEAVCRTLDVPADSVRVILRDVAADDWAVAGLPIREYLEKKKG